VVSGGAGYVGTAARMLGYAGDVYQAGKALSTGDWQTLAIQVASQAAGYAASKSAAGRAATKNTPHWDPKQSVGAPHMQGGKNGWCFTAGTLVAVAAGSKAIEEIKVGDRVLTTDDTADETEVNEATWFSVSVEALNPDGSGDVLEITRLCSPEWVVTHGCTPGASFHVELEEMRFAGMIATNQRECKP
ncbi:MAG: Hint domain-containing protein, partial [Planctomycetes bacterium]|nr:Hint domain-containing protein [Planctomycetota bacterium]